MIGVPMNQEFRAILEVEAWQQHITLAEHVRRLLEASRTPDGRQRRGIVAMRKRGRPANE